MERITILLIVLLVTGCGDDVDSPKRSTKQDSTLPTVQPAPNSTSSNFTSEPSNGIPLTEEDGLLTIEGVLEGSWLRQQSGETLGDYSKSTLLEPLRLKAGSRSFPLVGMTEELEHALLENSGKTVRLRGRMMRWIEDGRGNQNAQAGYTGPMPAHVVEFLTVLECEEIVPKME